MRKSLLLFLLLIPSALFGQAQGSFFSGTVQTQTGLRAGATITVCSTAVIANSPTGATESGTTVTITTNSAHGFVAGQVVQVAGVTQTLYNGTFTILTVPTTTTFTYTNSNSGLAASGQGAVLPTNVPCTPTASIFSDIGLTAAKTNPTTTDGLGNFSFYASPGLYVYTVTGSGIPVSSGGPFTFQLPCIAGQSCVASSANNTFTGNTTFLGAISAFTLDSVKFFDSNHYAATQSGFQSFVNDVVAVNGIGIVAPGTTLTISSCTTDAESTYGILIGPSATSAKFYGYGVTLNATYPTAGCDAIVIRDSEQVTFEGFRLLEPTNPRTGNGIAVRRPSNANPGFPATGIHILHNYVNGFNVGIRIGVASDTGQVSENRIDENQVYDCLIDIQQASVNTATNIYMHNITASVAQNNTILWDLGGDSATLIAPVTGDGSTTGTIHLQFEASLADVTIITPHIEIEQNGGSDVGGRGINWLSSGLDLEVEGGIFQDFRTTGTSTLFQMNNASTAGMAFFRNTQVVRSGGTATLAVTGGPGLCAEGGQWANTSVYPVSGCVRSAANGSVANGFVMPVNTGARTWTMQDATDTVVMRNTTDTLTNKSTPAGALVGTVASGTATMPTAAIASQACGTVVTVAASGVLTTDSILANDNAQPAAATNGVLTIKSWPTANNVNVFYCNPTAASITPGAATVNWRVTR